MAMLQSIILLVKKIGQGVISNSRAVVEIPNAGHGLYLVKGSNNKTVKILR